MRASPSSRFAALGLAGVLVACTTGQSPVSPSPSVPTADSTSTPTSTPASTCDDPVPAIPGLRGYHDMATLTSELGVLLQGGETAPPPEGAVLIDSWTFTSSGGWTSHTRCPAPPWGEIAYDAESGQVVVVGWAREGWVEVEETWAFDVAHREWALVAEDSAPGGFLTYDVESDRIIGFGLDGTWAYDVDSGTWYDMEPAVEPPTRDFLLLDYDDESDRVILFGGVKNHEALGDTWVYDFNTNTWTEMSPATAPAPRFYSAMTYDPVADRMIVFGGADGPFLAEVPFEDTWAYDVNTDSWTELDPTSSPPARGWHAMAFEPASGRVVLFGGGPDRDHFQADTWIYYPAANAWGPYPEH